jgi:hypothetical protein
MFRGAIFLGLGLAAPIFTRSGLRLAKDSASTHFYTFAATSPISIGVHSDDDLFPPL